MTPDGLIVHASQFDTAETIERLVNAITGYGMTVVARVDHASAAAAVGLALGPATVLVFGNPRAGTALMQAVPTMALDLPLRALVWEDAGGQAWIGYNDPVWLARRHGIDADAAPLHAMVKALAGVVHEAGGESPQT